MERLIAAVIELTAGIRIFAVPGRQLRVAVVTMTGCECVIVRGLMFISIYPAFRVVSC